MCRINSTPDEITNAPAQPAVSRCIRSVSAPVDVPSITGKWKKLKCLSGYKEVDNYVSWCECCINFTFNFCCSWSLSCDLFIDYFNACLINTVCYPATLVVPTLNGCGLNNCGYWLLKYSISQTPNYLNIGESKMQCVSMAPCLQCISLVCCEHLLHIVNTNRPGFQESG